MSERVNPALEEALRDVGRPTTPEELRRRGVRKVRSVGMQEVSLLIERAVSRTLIERTQRVSERELKELVDAAQDDFTEQLQGLRDLSSSQELIEKHKQDWRSSLESLRDTVQKRRGFVEAGAGAGAAAAASSEGASGLTLRRDVSRLVRSMIREVSDLEPVAAELTERLTGALVTLLGERLDWERDELRRQHDRELSQLERRVTKLVTSLEKTERALEQAASARAADLGIASIYKDVQGLDEAEQDRELKSALMSRIFEANLALRTSMNSQGEVRAEPAG